MCLFTPREEEGGLRPALDDGAAVGHGGGVDSAGSAAGSDAVAASAVDAERGEGDDAEHRDDDHEADDEGDGTLDEAHLAGMGGLEDGCGFCWPVLGWVVGFSGERGPAWSRE